MVFKQYKSDTSGLPTLLYSHKDHKGLAKPQGHSIVTNYLVRVGMDSNMDSGMDSGMGSRNCIILILISSTFDTLLRKPE